LSENYYKYTDEYLLSVIREQIKDGVISSRDVDAKIVEACRKHFENWENACEKVGAISASRNRELLKQQRLKNKKSNRQWSICADCDHTVSMKCSWHINFTLPPGTEYFVKKGRVDNKDIERIIVTKCDNYKAPAKRRSLRDL